MEDKSISGNTKRVRIKVILGDHLPHKPASDIAVRNKMTTSSLQSTLNTFNWWLKYSKMPVMFFVRGSRKDPCALPVPSAPSAAPTQRQSRLMLLRCDGRLLRTAINKSSVFSSKHNNLSPSLCYKPEYLSEDQGSHSCSPGTNGPKP